MYKTDLTTSLRLRSAGFTFIELLITLTLVAILLTIANMTYAHATYTVHTNLAKTKLNASLMTARTKAISSGVDVVLCPSNSQESCAGSPRWDAGWIVFVDLNEDEQYQSSDILIERQKKLDSRVHIATSVGRTKIQMQPNGGNAGSNASFTFCDPRGYKKAFALIMNNNGILREAPASSSGSALACAGF